jgi:hypothetical protein
MKTSLQKIQDEVRAIDEEMQALSVRRAKLTASITVSGKTRYHRGNPRRPGYYYYSSLSCAPTGGAIGKWNGKTWESLTGWGDYTNRGEEIVWYGEGKSRRDPMSSERVANLGNL